MGSDAVRDGARLAALRDTALLDADADQAFSRLNRLAVQLLGVPVSLVSLVGEDRQFFAGHTGLPEPWASYRETPLSHSFCQHVVDQDQPLVVGDARTDPVVSENLAVRDLDVIAYAGIPLRMPDGNVLGSFCAIDSKPRAWSEHELEILEDLAELTSEMIELRRVRRLPAARDPLTGLPDRALFGQLVTQSFSRAERAGRCTAMFAIGLDGFRLINDALGHAAGDQILVYVARRLTDALRGSDAVCRLAGDEFLVLCESANDQADALRVAERTRQAVILSPVAIGDHDQAIAATIGVACTSSPGDADELIQAALHNLATAKNGAEPTTKHSQPGLTASLQNRRRLELRNGIAGAHTRGELHVVYQPLIELSTGQMTGVEALLRWQHPDLGPISPDEFIPAAEKSGAIITIGEWVLQQACSDLAAWRRDHSSHDLTLAVNVAALQLRTANFSTVVAATLQQHNLPASSLTLEITERTLLDDRNTHQLTIDRLHALGIRLALDDFGTGYSSMAYLTRLPIDVLKIDRTLIKTITTDPRAAVLVKGILAITYGLNMQTVAEGIETEAQHQLLASMGCQLAQGYLFSPPVPAATIAAVITTTNTDADSPDAGRASMSTSVA